MFRKSLKEKLERVFGISKVSFSQPGEAQEQECLFIAIDSTVSRIRQGKAVIRAVGYMYVFANSEKIPFGFFNKRILQADASDTHDIFFYDIDKNRKYFGNLVERGCKFVYFYNEQYDPDAGTITSINFIEGESEE